MIKLSVLNPAGQGKILDMEDYMNRHVPLVSATLGDILKASGYDKD